MPFSEIIQLHTSGEGRRQSLAKLRQTAVWGFEVSDEQLSRHCQLGNIDPQHLQKVDISAIESTLAGIKIGTHSLRLHEVQEGKVTAATIRPDADSLGAIALAELASSNSKTVENSAITARVTRIGEADRFNNGPWPGVQPLPTCKQPWFEDIPGDNPELLAIAALADSRDISLRKRVNQIKNWLTTGDSPPHYVERVKQNRYSMIKSLERGDIEIKATADSRVAKVISAHYGGLRLGYRRAPIVIAQNPNTKKVTIGQYDPDHVALHAVFRHLNEQEALARHITPRELKNKWGGSITVGGSPQGEGTKLSLDEVIATTIENLPKHA